jgi:hypothetical protein
MGLPRHLAAATKGALEGAAGTVIRRYACHIPATSVTTNPAVAFSWC